MKFYLVLLIVSIFSSVCFAEDSKFSGFVDFQYRWIEDYSSYKTGFQIYDAAFYYQKNLNTQTLFFIDAPVSSKEPDVSGSTVVSSNELELWQGKAQMYLSHQYQNSTFYFGQFDSVFGVEANDTLHNPLPIEGIMNQQLPSVHRGVMLTQEFKEQDIKLDIIAGNQESSGYDNKRPLEWGLNAFKKWEHIHASLGYLYSRDSGQNNEMANFIASFFLNKIKVDVEYSWVRKISNLKDTVGGSIRLSMPVKEGREYQFLAEQADEVNSLARQRLFVISGSEELMKVVKLKIGVGLRQNWETTYEDKSSDQAMFTSSLLYSF